MVGHRSLTPDSHQLVYPVTAEVYITQILNRDEFRKHCDTYKTQSAILKNLKYTRLLHCPVHLLSYNKMMQLWPRQFEGVLQRREVTKNEVMERKKLLLKQLQHWEH